MLPTIQCPALIVHLRDDPLVPLDARRHVADHIPGARWAVVPGADDLWWSAGSAGAVLDEIEEFLTGVRSTPSTNRVLSTALFTDIVSSTARATELGDRQWSEMLDRHDAAVRRQLNRFRGTEGNTTGDGFVATFDGPARAVECACAIRDAHSTYRPFTAPIAPHTEANVSGASDPTGWAMPVTDATSNSPRTTTPPLLGRFSHASAGEASMSRN